LYTNILTTGGLYFSKNDVIVEVSEEYTAGFTAYGTERTLTLAALLIASSVV